MPNFELWHSCRKLAIYLQLQCTNPGSLVARVTKFCNMPHNNFITICTVNINTYHFTCDKQAVPDKGEVYRLLQNCGSPVWNLLHATLLAPRNFRFLRDFWKICGTVSSRQQKLKALALLRFWQLQIWKLPSYGVFGLSSVQKEK
jgi:hypothetical protein